MKYNPNIHKRHSIRLKKYDYANIGAYFITICLNRRVVQYYNQNDFPILGHVENGVMILNDCGKMVEKWILKIKNDTDKFSNINLGEYIIMPDHVHAIIEIKKIAAAVELGTVIQWFKTMVSNEYIENVKTKNWIPFNKKLWQRNYYESIIRNKTQYSKITEYIKNNPALWQKYYLKEIF